jgi:uncharacterized protein
MVFWSKIVGIILRNKVSLLIFIALMTVFMLFFARKAEMIYEFPDLLPDSDTNKIAYQHFQDRFGKTGTILLVGTKENPLEDLSLYQSWTNLSDSLKKIHGVDSVISLVSVFNLNKNQEEKKFELVKVVSQRLQNEQELDSVRKIIFSLPFYKGLLYNDSSKASLIAISLNPDVFNSEGRDLLIQRIDEKINEFSTQYKNEVYVSGLPYIRTVVTSMIRKEMGVFVLLSLAVMIIILSFFFRSGKVVAISILVVTLGVIWFFGALVLLDYKITILTALVPTLVIVIGVPNCIFLINKFHAEFLKHGNKVKALSRVIEKIGNATLLTNATTASGFITFVFTKNPLLIEFGIVASISIMFVFLLAIIIVPISLSYFPEPKMKHLNHQNKKWITNIILLLEGIVRHHRTKVYYTTIFIVAVSFYGLTLLKTTGNVVDDVPKNHKIVTDLQFFEKQFGGVLPFEINIDAKKPSFADKEQTINKIEKLYVLLAEYPELSRPISIIDGMKFTKQAYYNGKESKYELITRQEKPFFKPYFEDANKNNVFLNSFMDSTKQYTRVSVQMADIGTKEMDILFQDIYPKIQEIFPTDKYQVDIVGPSIIFLKGTTYLVKNLKTSLLLAIGIIVVIMSLLFSSWRMVLVSLIPNLIPLLITGAIMGFFNIPIKPSTILVFSIAFGISVDDTIHFLAKYRQELKLRNWHIGDSVYAALRETGVSMIYTSIVLFFGFGLFVSSDFGGTMALGVLISVTLLVAMLSNLILLPSFLITLEKSITNKAFKEPLLEIFNEEEDIDLNNLVVGKSEEFVEKEIVNENKIS